MLALAVSVVAVDVNQSLKNDAEAFADLARCGECLACAEAAELAKTPCTLDLHCVENRKDLVAACVDDRGIGSAHIRS